MNSPLVSVVIPTFNRAHLIAETLKSVLNQDYTNLEVIIVDDASDDFEALKGVVSDIFADQIPYLLLRHERNRHGGAARNTGMAASKGKYIALLDSDDIWFENKVSKCVSALEKHSDVDFVYSGIELNVGKQLYAPKRGIDENESVADYLLFSKQSMQTSSLVLRRSTTFDDGIKFDERLTRFQDYDLTITLDIAGKKSFYINEVLVKMLNVDVGNRISNETSTTPVDFWLKKVKAKISNRAYATFLIDRKVKMKVYNNQYIEAWKLLLSPTNFINCSKPVYLRAVCFALTPPFVRHLVLRFRKHN